MKEQADAMLGEYGILEALGEFGEVYIHGSYEMDLMVWPEIDIYVLIPGFQSRQVYSIMQKLHDRVPPQEVMIINQVDHERRYGPGGCVIVDYHILHRNTEWKLDLAVADKDAFNWVRNYNATLREKMSPTQHAIIKTIKQEAVNSPLYRRANWRFIHRPGFFYSGDIYHAVLEHGIADYDSFAAYLREKNGIDVKAGTEFRAEARGISA
jgi:hypothetical protein